MLNVALRKGSGRTDAQLAHSGSGFINLPVHTIPLTVDAVQGNQRSRSASLPDRLESERLAFHRFHPLSRFNIVVPLQVNGHRALRPAARRKLGWASIAVILHLLCKPILAQAASQHNRPVQYGLLRGVAEQSFCMQAHGELHFDSVAIGPGAVDFQVASRAGECRQRLAIQRHGTSIGPTWYPYVNASRHWSVCLHGEACAFLLREMRILTNSKPLFRPANFRGDEQVHKSGMVVPEVNRIAEFRKLFSACSRAAPERIEFRVEKLPVPGFEREIVHL